MGLLAEVGTFMRTGQPAISSKRAAKTVAEYSEFDLLIPHWARYNEELFVRLAYRQNPIVYGAIEYNARSVATATIYAMRVEETGQKRLSPGHKLQRLLRRPSRMYATQTRWIRQIIRQLMITGECFVYLARDRGGSVGETQILPGHAITVIPATVGIRHYEYRPNGRVEPVIIQPEDLVFLKFDDPYEPMRGCSPLSIAWRETQTDNSTTDYRKAFFDNSAIPGGVLTTNLPANAEQLRQWSEDFSDRFSGAKNAGKTPALAGGLAYQKAGATPGEVDFSNVTALSETRICMAFGMHPVLIAAKAGLDRSTYSNFKEAKAAYWEDTAVPLMGLIEDDLTVGLTSLADSNAILFDTSKVPALQEDKNRVSQRATRALKDGAITVNEYREMIGYNPVPDGNVYYRPTGLLPVPKGDLDEPPPEKTPSTNGSVPPDPQNTGRPPNEPGEEEHAPAPNSPEGTPIRTSENTSSRTTASASAYLPKAHSPLGTMQTAHTVRQLSAMEASLRDDIMRVLAAQARIFREGLGEAARRAGYQPREEPDGPLVSGVMDLLWDRSLQVARTSGAVRSRMGRIARSSAEDSGAGEWGTNEAEKLADWLDDQTIRLGNAISDETERRVRHTLAKAMTGGEAIGDLGALVGDVVEDETRANTIAVDQAKRASEAGRRFAHEGRGYTRQIFVANEGACEYCRALDGTEVGIGGAFARLGETIHGVEGGSLPVGYDDIRGANVHPNCGCSTRYETDTPNVVAAEEEIERSTGWFDLSAGAKALIMLEVASYRSELMEIPEHERPGKDHGPSIKCPDVYEALKKKYSKEKAAKISNDCWSDPNCSCH